VTEDLRRFGVEVAERPARDVARVAELERGVMTGTAARVFDAAHGVVKKQMASEVTPEIANLALIRREGRFLERRRPLQALALCGLTDLRVQVGCAGSASGVSTTAPGGQQHGDRHESLDPHLQLLA